MRVGRGVVLPLVPRRLVGEVSRVEMPEEVAATIRRLLEHVPPERLSPCTNCGMAPLSREVASAKLRALGEGAARVRAELGGARGR